MAEIAKKYQDELPKLKKCVEQSYTSWKPNADRFNHFRKFVFKSSLDSDIIALLKTLKKPTIEFNILESYISRLRGEFSKQEPSIEVMAGDDGQVDINTINVVQGHFKHILCDANKDGFEYQMYTDTLSGGYSVGKLWTEYSGPMSMDQVIKIGRVYDPVLCGFDPLARQPHKGDGNYCFELFPKSKEDFKLEYPDIDLSGLKFNRAMEGFNWTYRNLKEDILLLCDYYKKKKRKVKIVKLTNGKVMTVDDYKKFEQQWIESGVLEQIPQIVGKPRITEIESICRYRFIDNCVLEYVETDFKILPLIFFDGNSIIIRQEVAGNVEQMTRPYVYQAKGMQLLKNFAGQTLANELENMIQHKFMISKDALPNEEDYLDAYRNVQQADVLVFNQYKDNDPNIPLQPPQVVQRVPIPPEVTQTFQGTDQMTQMILGNFDMDIGRMNKSQTSGIAIVEAATQNNSAAMPYIVGYLQGLSRMAEGVLDLIPKYFKTPRTMPIVLPDGKRAYVPVNQQGGIDVQYDSGALNVKVEAGVNFSVQKSKALSQVIALMQASPLFAEFINTAGLSILLDNIEIKGIDQIKEMANQWMQQQQQMKQQQMEQMKNQPNPAMMKMQVEQGKLQHEMMKTEIDASVSSRQLKIDEQKLMADMVKAATAAQVAVKKADTEIAARGMDMAMKEMDMRHKHAKETIETHHKLTSDKEKKHGKET